MIIPTQEPASNLISRRVNGVPSDFQGGEFGVEIGISDDFYPPIILIINKMTLNVISRQSCNKMITNKFITNFFVTR